MEYFLTLIAGLLFGGVISKFIKFYPNLDRFVIIVISSTLFTLSWFIQLPSILTSLTGIFYIGMLLFLLLKKIFRKDYQAF
jgi:hypothetical protein